MATGTMGGCDPVVFEMAGCLFRVGGGSPEFAEAFDEIAGFLDEGAVAGVVADVFVAVVSGEPGSLRARHRQIG